MNRPSINHADSYQLNRLLIASRVSVEIAVGASVAPLPDRLKSVEDAE